ncbi:MAG: multiheme c-type cytochrome [Bacteroidota bacterium]|nr:multiheme c-type cytochrome [Bacteroidota bacterium]
MKRVVSFIIVLSFLVSSFGLAQNKFVGAKTCAPCHKTGKQGKQDSIWVKSKHAGAYKTLTTETAQKIAKEKGLKKAANESPECLECHVTAPKGDAKLLDKGYNKAEGISCESCHGAGSAYKTMAIMKDAKKAVEAGLTEFKDEKAIEAYCVTCHNEKSPTYIEFKFKEAWAQIAHPLPKK